MSRTLAGWILCHVLVAVGSVPPTGAALDPPSSVPDYELVLVGNGPAYDVNSWGWVVGTTDPYGGQAFLWKDGQSQSLLPPGATEAIAYGVNDAGQVALYGTFDQDPTGRAYTWSPSGGFTQLGSAPGQSYSEAWDLNDAGVVVGFAEDEFGYVHASQWVGGAWSSIGGTVQPNSSWAFAINNLGQAVGFVAEGPAQACIFDSGAVLPIGAGDYSSAYGVNDLGQVVGRTRPAVGTFDLWVYAEGAFTTIATGSFVQANDINNRGQVVGTVEQNAFLWQNGVLYDLNGLVPDTPGLRIAHGINDCGVIVGETDDGLGFMLVPSVIDSTDTDADDLLDVWELCGVDADADGSVDLVLPNADPERKDLYVELDAMVGHVPTQAALDAVVAAFADAPIGNPDGSTGLSLHFVGSADPAAPDAACDPCVDESDLAAVAWGDLWGGFQAEKANRFGSPAERAHPNAAAILEAKRLTFRYGISAQSFTGVKDSVVVTTASGLGEYGGNDFMVTPSAALGDRPVTDDAMAGTIMHEIGHTLYLGHGGDQDDDPFNFKPNYHSVMNYLWQMPVPNHELGEGSLADDALRQLRDSWELRYSDGSMNDLDETALDEAAGLGGDPNRFTVVGTILNGNPPGLPRLIPMDGPIDWNNDGDTNDIGVEEDVNFLVDIYPFTSVDVLTSPNDWDRIVFLPNDTPDWQNGTIALERAAVTTEMVFDELDASTIDALAALRFDCNRNGVHDDLEIGAGTAQDLDQNGIPDECEGVTVVGVDPVSDGASGLELGPARPNPTSGPTSVAFVLRRRTAVEVTVYDVAGRVVRRLADGSRDAGAHVVRWNGRDAEGRSVGAGTYFLRVRADGEDRSVKVLVGG